MSKSRKGFYSMFLLLGALILTISRSSLALTSENSNINLYSYNELNIDSDDINAYKSILSEEMGIDVQKVTDNDLLLYAIYSNDNLSLDEKSLVYKIDDLINDCCYIQKEDAFKNLINLIINYKKSDNSSIAGKYIPSNDIIEIYEDDEDSSVLYHEIIHALFYNKNTSKLPCYFAEGMTELLNNEYFSDEPFIEDKNYPYQIIMTKLLCELTSSDTVMKSFSTGNMNYIYDDLCGYGNYNLEDIKTYFSELSNLFTNIDNLTEDDLKKYNDLVCFFDSVYSLKNKDTDNDNCNYLYLRNLLDGMISDNKYLVYFNNLEKYGISNKAYFNKKISDEFLFTTYENNVKSKILVK